MMLHVCVFESGLIWWMMGRAKEGRDSRKVCPFESHNSTKPIDAVDEYRLSIEICGTRGEERAQLVFSTGCNRGMFTCGWYTFFLDIQPEPLFR